METEKPSFSILMFPWLGHGHITPFLELAKRLSKRGFHIYFCSTAVNLSTIKTTMEKEFPDLSIELILLHLPPLPELPPQYHTTKALPPNLMPSLTKAFQLSISGFSTIINNLNPDLVIYDGMQPWAAKLASIRGIPALHFAILQASTLLYMHHYHTHGTTSPFPYLCLSEDDMKDMNALLESLRNIIVEEDKDFSFGNFKRSSEIVLIKTCKAIEGKYIDSLSSLCHKKLVPVGSLVAETGTSGDKNSEIIQWLDKKKQHSTVYICFGSEYLLSEEEAIEIARGLEQSNINFIWVVKFQTGDKNNTHESLPKGFLDRVKERGMVVEWAQQAKLLAHSSIGGFVSHCGWASMMESISFGVPVIAMPMKYEQPISAKLVVEAGIAVEVERAENGLYKGEKVAKAITTVMTEKTGEELRNKARELNSMIKREDEQDMNEVVWLLYQICMKNQNTRNVV